MTNILLLVEKLIKEAKIGALGATVAVAGTMAGSIAIVSAQEDAVAVQDDAVVTHEAVIEEQADTVAVQDEAIQYPISTDNREIEDALANKVRLSNCISKAFGVSVEQIYEPDIWAELHKSYIVTDLVIRQADDGAADGKAADGEAILEMLVETATIEDLEELPLVTLDEEPIENLIEYATEYVAETNTDSAERGNELVEYAVQFVGNPYVWGGSSLTDGADCSGFTMTLYGMYGIELPHSSLSQASYGVAVDGIDDAIPGDLMVYNGHVAIYIGNGQMVHAANSRLGICITGIDFMDLVGIRRLL